MLICICQFSYGHQINIYKSNKLYIDDKLIISPLISNELATNIIDQGETFKISNQYSGSAITKTEVKYTFNKSDLILTKVEKFNYNTQYDNYYGYNIDIVNGKSIFNISNNDIESLEDDAEPENYSYGNENNLLTLKLKLKGKNIKYRSHLNKDKYIFLINYYKNKSMPLKIMGYQRCIFDEQIWIINECQPLKFLKKKSFLYFEPDLIAQSKMYLIEGEQVVILKQKYENNQKWYFINYKGKKDINMWIKAEAVDFNEKE